jgi:WD40 repeat protein
MNILPPCLCNKPRNSAWLKLQCSNCLGVLKDSQSINCNYQTNLQFNPSDTFSKSIIDYLSVSNKSIHKRSCTDKTQDSFINFSNPSDKNKLLRNPSEPLLIHKAKLSAPVSLYKKKEYLKLDCVLVGHTNSVNSIAVSDNKIWTAGQDYKILSWVFPSEDYCTRTNITVSNSPYLVHTKPISQIISYRPDCLITASMDKTVKLCKITEKLSNSVVFRHNSGVKAVIAAEKSIISGTSDSRVHIWDINSHKCIISYTEHMRALTAIENFKTNTFLSGSEDCSLKLWDSRTAHSISNFYGHCDSVSSIKILNPHSFWSGSKDNTVKTWDIRTSGVLETINTQQEVNSIENFREFIVVAGEKLQLWNKGILLWENYSRAKCVKYCSSNRNIIVGSYDNSISTYKIIF